jgi:hypothetical protein
MNQTKIHTIFQLSRNFKVSKEIYQEKRGGNLLQYVVHVK